ncbi:tRNA-splicing endonuclease subunit Sen15 [Pygocentrus nattereri]|uniref:tRNA-splicing endonuclease subunit Sen15 domain-containing protein n=1 Tax=Pygocentrus nattereri TaxID=42514 RepID=A0A3B4CHB6_PYGNA|nr:tRNA-splicing endonuclease subunit Sen15 [Pygocentrus nattereri]
MDEDNTAGHSSWIKQHPVYEDLMNLDVGDGAQVYAAFLVYLNLTEVRGWEDVVGVACPELQVVLLEGREKEGELVRVVYPLPAHRTVSHKDLRCILDRGHPMLLCAVASDSTLVYQQLCDGLLTPEPPVGIQDQGRRQHRKRRLQT